MPINRLVRYNYNGSGRLGLASGISVAAGLSQYSIDPCISLPVSNPLTPNDPYRGRTAPLTS